MSQSQAMTRREMLVSLVIAGSHVMLAAAPEEAGASGLSFQAAGRAEAAAPQPLPPVSWTCPMHAEVVEDRAGSCPICHMTLVPVRLALVWTCSVHPNLTYDKAGQCGNCGRPLVRVTKAVSWTCPVHSKVDVLEPGRCPICKRTLRVKYSRRPHGDHNPKHGGLFFMAPNNWHLEATYPTRGLVRLYVYDEYSDPFIPAGFTGRTIIGPHAAEQSVQFRRIAGRAYLEARISPLAVPASIIVKVRFQPADPEYLFNFEFLDYSREPVARVPNASG